MDSPPLPAAPQEWHNVMMMKDEPVLALSIRRPEFPNTGKTARIERWFDHLAQQWKTRWETLIFPRACQAMTEAGAQNRIFRPWRTELDYTITLWQEPLLSLRLDATEAGQQVGRPSRFCMGETWDCASGYPRTLRSFFPVKAHHWHKELLDSLKDQAAQQLASGESLLDPDYARIMERSFDPDRFYLTETGITVFYPMYLLGPYAEGIPSFTVPMPA